MSDYKDTVFLPRTAFAMKASLPQREPAQAERWDRMGLYRLLREASAGRDRFVLHDGPPYANGHLHSGTALNKILKDVVNRGRQMLGYDAAYVPGWDCHGLPIEWQVEQEYRKKGRNKDEVPVVQFRQECREYAQKWLGIQRDEFKRLGVVGDWEGRYATMDFAAEADIYRELGKFLLDGELYRGLKAVMWSVVEKTALAEAEVEYHEVTSTTAYVRFPVIKASVPVLEGASVVIWTTTPWTIPANRAIAYGPEIDYLVVRVDEAAEGSRARPGDVLVVGAELLTAVATEARIVTYTELAALKGEELAGTVCAHPLRGHADGYGFDVPLFPAEFVTTEQGTGLVHIAPSHGEDDYELGAKHGLEVPETVADDGSYTAAVPGFEGLKVFDGRRWHANGPVIEALGERGALLASGTLHHTYPHSWRSKAPIVFRATAQWFIPMEGPRHLRETALAAIDATRFVPPKGKNRLRSMVEARPDWCVSRQRAWGVPIAVFVNKDTGEVLRDPEVVERIARAFEAEGADAWWTRDPQEFLGDAYAAADYDKVDDILDVWFESGCTHAFVLERRSGELRWPADVYLEGSDQHRGWFQSSLLESCGTRGRAPFNTVLTHGFVMDAQGRKMSKSLGNTVSPADLLKTYGADILRLWVASADYSEDLRIGKEILDGVSDGYRRLRNTLRYLLGNLDGFSDSERLPVAEMPELERWVLHRLAELGALVRECNEGFDFARFYAALTTFCGNDLSAFYFDVRKDSLYCDPVNGATRRAARTVLDETFRCLTAWLAPVLVFTAEEAWLTRFPSETDSVHLRTFPEIPADWRDDALAARWERVREVRRVVTGALEIERKEKRIGSSLQAAPVVYLPADGAAALEGLDLAELAITSGVELRVGGDAAPEGAFALADVPGVAVVPAPAGGEKCARCWRVLPEVAPETGQICHRCADALPRRAA